MTILDAVAAAEQRELDVRNARARVDLARIKHDRIQRELRTLEQRPKQHQNAVEAFRSELALARVELRAASRALLKAI